MTRLARLVALLLSAMVASPTLARAPAPVEGCIDARAVERVRRVDASTLLLATGEARFVIQHVEGCDARHASSLLGANGWVCPGEESYLRTADLACAIHTIEIVDDRTYSALAAKADRDTAATRTDGRLTLAPVEVIAPAERPPGFRGDTDYCLRPDAVRAFHLDHGDLYVTTSARRSGGNQRYRVELTTSCPQLAWARRIAFESSLGIGVICGHPGDNLLPIEQEDVPADGEDMVRPSNPRAIGRQCGISAVYPVR
ncbi:hypothetical protein OS187_00110 [Xanthomonadaceae bacterium JHOS43]|nr:hypothetical protein [Xanthomonadaceae bacterium JHOS43]